MFDETACENNLFRIIEEFSNKSKTIFILLLMSFVHSSELNANDVETTVDDKLKQMGISCNLSIVLANESVKEHGRGIFTNYLRVKSGNSSVYFKSGGDFLTKATDIEFHSLAESDKFNASEAALSNIRIFIEKLGSRPDKDKRLFGTLKNGLIKT